MIESIEEIVIITPEIYELDDDVEFYNPLSDNVPNVGFKIELLLLLFSFILDMIYCV